MDKFTLALSLSTDEGKDPSALPRWLRGIASRIDGYQATDGFVRDVNGNTVGSWRIRRDPPARVPKYVYEYVLQGNYGESAGWEDITAESTLTEAHNRMVEYVNNEGLNMPSWHYRVVTRRTPNPEAS